MKTTSEVLKVKSIYKCRACGQVYEKREYYPSNDINDFVEIAEGFVMGARNHFKPHKCADNRMGLADLQQIKYDL